MDVYRILSLVLSGERKVVIHNRIYTVMRFVAAELTLGS